MRKFVAYYRVSTKGQGKSGLGLEAQKRIIEASVKRLDGEIVLPEFVEVESGTNKERISVNQSLNLDSLLKKRPVLLAAINQAKEEGATLIAKDISRFSRFTLLIDYMISTGIDFVCAEYPNDSPMFLKMRANFAEEEAKEISRRTKAALESKKMRDGEWRVNTITPAKRAKAIEAIKAKAASNQDTIKATDAASDKRTVGKSLQVIANELNAAGYKTPRGKSFSRVQVKRLLDRVDVI